ncbi:hypothetical protein D3C72_2345190 [compost metagenome]
MLFALPIRWTCASLRPGMRNLPLPSISTTPSDASPATGDVDTATTWVPSVRTSTLSCV